MKAIQTKQFGSLDYLTLEENVSVPSLKHPNQETRAGVNFVCFAVLIKVYTAGINQWDAVVVLDYLPQLKIPLPHIPGVEGSGTIESVGASVTQFKAGDRVYFMSKTGGTYAEYAVIDEQYVYPLPQWITFQQGAGIPIAYFTAYRALFHRAKARYTDSILIHGASGAVGLAACQIASTYKMTVYGTAGSLEGLQLVKTAGAEHTFNHREDGYISKIQHASAGIDVIIELAGTINIEADISLLKPGGRIIIVGSKGPGQLHATPSLLQKEAQILGNNVFMMSADEYEETKKQVCAGIEKGYLHPIVGTEFPLVDGIKGLKESMQQSATKGKLVINIVT